MNKDILALLPRTDDGKVIFTVLGASKESICVKTKDELAATATSVNIPYQPWMKKMKAGVVSLVTIEEGKTPKVESLVSPSKEANVGRDEATPEFEEISKI